MEGTCYCLSCVCVVVYEVGGSHSESRITPLLVEMSKVVVTDLRDSRPRDMTYGN